jgi:SAM-dependent methyltransferase
MPAYDRGVDTRKAKGIVRNVAGELPAIGPLLAHREALIADRDALLEVRAGLTAELEIAQAELHEKRLVAEQLRQTEIALAGMTEHRDQLDEAAQSLAAEKEIIIAQREALQVFAHQHLLYRNQPRTYLADRFLRGDGIEIGALHRPVPLPEGVTVRYVDRLYTDDLRSEYNELSSVEVVEPTIIDDGELLDHVPTNSVDFIVANHFLEHCQDPIGTILVHLNRLRDGGHLFYAIPEKRYTFDNPRATTTLEHLIQDHTDGGASSRVDHFTEYGRIVMGSGEPERTGRELMDADYSIHFHAWTSIEMIELFMYIQRTYEPNLEIIASQAFEDEFILVCRKNAAV